MEVSPRGGHFLAFGVDEEIAHDGRGPTAICEAVAAAGGVGFAAHPFSTGSRMVGTRIAPSHAWPALEDGCCAGLELWSLTTDEAEAWRTPLEALRFLRAPEAAEPPAAHLAAWDALCARRRMVAIGGLDAHQPGVRVCGRVHSPMPHARYFGLLRTHVVCAEPLDGDLDHDRRVVLDALRRGSCFLVRPALGDAAGARFWAVPQGGAPVAMGGETRSGPTMLHARLPRAADLRVVGAGTVVAEEDDADELAVGVDAPGAYRLEARREGRVWLLGNPVYLR
jgi:hypothetical protein